MSLLRTVLNWIEGTAVQGNERHVAYWRSLDPECNPYCDPDRFDPEQCARCTDSSCSLSGAHKQQEREHAFQPLGGWDHTQKWGSGE